MSRVISVQDSITLVPSGYDSSNSDYSGVSNSYPISNGYDGSSSTNYAYITCHTGSYAETYISYTFNVSAIPRDAVINSVSCTAKTRVSSTSYISSSTIQLYSDSTAKGYSTSAASTSANAREINSTGTWTRAELDNVQIRLTGTRGSRNTNRAAYLYFYGADLTVDYSINGTAYTITASSSVSSTTVEPSSQEIIEGKDATIRIDTSNINDVIITDNGNEINHLLEMHQQPTGGTISVVPASYTTSGSINGTRYQHTVGCGVDNPSGQTGNDYASGNEATIYYHFNFDNIPDNATITNMRVRAYGHLESTSNSSEIAELNTYYGTTAKGTSVSYTSTSSQLMTIPAGT